MEGSALARSVPLLRGNTLEVAGEAIIAGTTAWYAWLDGSSSFAFEGPQGIFTARKEGRERGGWYWKAYSRRGGKLRHAYLGKAEALTPEYLHAIALELARYNRQEL